MPSLSEAAAPERQAAKRVQSEMGTVTDVTAPVVRPKRTLGASKKVAKKG